jgi:hypothetical protein
LLALVGITVLASCSERQPAPITVPVQDADVQYYSGSGTCSIEGIVFGVQGSVFASLYPHIAYLGEVLRVRGEPSAATDPRYVGLVRVVEGTGGQFQFLTIPCGQYSLEVSWPKVVVTNTYSGVAPTIHGVAIVVPAQSSEIKTWQSRRIDSLYVGPADNPKTILIDPAAAR